MEKQLVLVANAHMHWDPDYSDVKLVQTMMFLSEVKNIIDKASRTLKPGVSGEHGTIPLVLCADLNSLPDSGKSTVLLFFCNNLNSKVSIFRENFNPANTLFHITSSKGTKEGKKINCFFCE